MTRLLNTSIFALCVLTATQAFAQLPDQQAFEPATNDHGVYSVQDQALGNADPDLAKAYDNFSITGPGYILTGIDWVGIYAEPLPGAVSDVDFLVEIWKDAAGVPDLGSGPILSKLYEDGNMIGEAGDDITVVGNGDVSPATSTTVGGGPGADYWGVLPGSVAGSFSGSTTLLAGDYWISIIASQTFENPAPVVDPEWQWHVSNPGGDGFYSRDRTLDPAGTPEYGLLITEDGSKDLAFTLKGELIPEPSGMLLGMLGMVGVGFLRRKRS